MLHLSVGGRLPCPGDFNGNGTHDIMVYDRSSEPWHRGRLTQQAFAATLVATITALDPLHNENSGWLRAIPTAAGPRARRTDRDDRRSFGDHPPTSRSSTPASFTRARTSMFATDASVAPIAAAISVRD